MPSIDVLIAWQGERFCVAVFVAECSMEKGMNRLYNGVCFRVVVWFVFQWCWCRWDGSRVSASESERGKPTRIAQWAGHGRADWPRDVDLLHSQNNKSKQRRCVGPAEESEWSVEEMGESTDYSCSSEARKRDGEVERVRICWLEGEKSVAVRLGELHCADACRSAQIPAC
jgi:hypothetical protein